MKKIFFGLVLMLTGFSLSAQNSNKRYSNAKYRKAAKKYYAETNGVVYGQTYITMNKNYFSQDRRYFFRFQDDGNLVVYRTSDNTALWGAQSFGKNAVICEFQTDANLVVRRTDNTVVWDAFSDQGKKKLTPAESAEAASVRKGRIALVMQNDGNLVIYNGPDKAVKWSSGTFEK